MQVFKKSTILSALVTYSKNKAFWYANLGDLLPIKLVDTKSRSCIVNNIFDYDLGTYLTIHSLTLECDINYLNILLTIILEDKV